jgi:phospholipid/cholesterol/gamma-HCH transport system substrate-binding protein
METNVRYTVAGLFVLAMFTFIILGIIWLSSGFSNEKYHYYLVYMKESVSGLTVDSSVEFNGVNVGKIDQININKKNPQLVELVLKLKETTPVTMGTKAKLGVRALSGMTYILLEDKGNDKRPLLAQNGEPYPVIETTPSILIRLDTTLTQMSDSFRQISNSFKSLLSPENLQAIRRLLQKLGGT